MNKKGFVSTGVVLSLFMLFIFLLLALLNIYQINSRLLSKEVIDVKNNLKLYDKSTNSIVLIDNLYFQIESVNENQYILTSISNISTNSDENSNVIIDKWCSEKINVSNAECFIVEENTDFIKPGIILENVLLTGDGTYSNPKTIVE